MRAQGLPSCYSMLGETNLGKLNQLVTRPSGKCPQWGRLLNVGFWRKIADSCHRRNGSSRSVGVTGTSRLPRPWQELVEAVDWYENRRPGLCVRFIEAFRDAADRIAENAYRYQSGIASN